VTATLLIAVVAVGAMGFAIQRGGTCAVAAVEEVLNEHRITRLAAILEASLWVAGGLAIAQLWQLAGSMPASHAITGWTIAGGVLLGLGAWVNGACVIGTVARLGSGQWAYVLTPLGFFVGSATALPLLAQPAAPQAPAPALVTSAAVFAPLFIAFAGWRLGHAMWSNRGSGAAALRASAWAPHAATIVIGITFVVTLLAAGRWSYTDVLAELAAGMADMAHIGLLLLVVLFAGALLAGGTAGCWRRGRPTATQLARCLAGGVLMAWGSVLIPGSNDDLVLIGIPLLLPYAWLAFATMCVTVAVALTVQRVWLARRRPPAN
jgi:toxin CptA